MSLAFLSRQRKITLTLAFILAWPATWLTEALYRSTHWYPIFEGQLHIDEEGRRSLTSQALSHARHYAPGVIQLDIVTEGSGWPFRSRIHRCGTTLFPGDIWIGSAGSARGGSGAIGVYVDVALLEEAIYKSQDWSAIDAWEGRLPPLGFRLFGWVGNIVAWWGLSCIGIVVTLALARGTDRAMREPREVRERDRISRGVCPGCAYDIRGLGEEACCPECGRPVPAEARRIAHGHPIEPAATDGDGSTKLSS